MTSIYLQSFFTKSAYIYGTNNCINLKSREIRAVIAIIDIYICAKIKINGISGSWDITMFSKIGTGL